MKKIILLTLACLFLFGNQALAHTGLESSNPANGSTVTEQLNEITLTFESKIEKASSFELKNTNNETFPISNLTVLENSLSGSVGDLENGPYTIAWKIIGADGHPINGEVAFVLNAPVSAETIEEKATETVNTPEVEPVVNVSEPTETKESSNTLIISFIVLLAILLAGSVWWMTRRKEK